MTGQASGCHTARGLLAPKFTVWRRSGVCPPLSPSPPCPAGLGLCPGPGRSQGRLLLRTWRLWPSALFWLTHLSTTARAPPSRHVTPLALPGSGRAWGGPCYVRDLLPVGVRDTCALQAWMAKRVLQPELGFFNRLQPFKAILWVWFCLLQLLAAPLP